MEQGRGDVCGRRWQWKMRAGFESYLEDLVLLQRLTRDVQGQVLRVDDTLDELEVLGHELLAVVHDEDAAHVQLDVVALALVAALEHVERRALGHEQHGLELELALDREVLDGRVLLPVVRQRLVERRVLLLRDLLRVAHPDGLLLVQVRPLVRHLLDLLRLLLLFTHSRHTKSTTHVSNHAPKLNSTDFHWIIYSPRPTRPPPLLQTSPPSTENPHIHDMDQALPASSSYSPHYSWIITHSPPPDPTGFEDPPSPSPPPCPSPRPWACRRPPSRPPPPPRRPRPPSPSSSPRTA